ncbi:MAG: ABC transporter ATP-binding protein, partial [Candidatus Hydrogenedentes bacterium]|nr:ABC transporter ATP-binding protein [Candidatus Hydrogenedentota bacterium]
KDEDTNKRRFYQKKTVRAVQDVLFGIKRGEVFGLLGPNGAGKTTLVKMVSGLVKPNSGIVYVGGLDVEKKRLDVLRMVGVVLEGTRTSIWPLTPLENLAYFGNLKDVRGKVLKSRSRELLEFIGLKDKMNVPVRNLSRGQKQKLAICIALIADPEVILLDEPTTGLDVQSGRSIKDKIIEMTRSRGKCVLVTTHDMNVAQEVCDRVGIINKGTLVACKPTKELIGVFSDLSYEFWLDCAPDMEALRQTPGVTGVNMDVAIEDPVCVVRLEADEQRRSEAVYGVIERLHAQNRILKLIKQREPRLEDVFLRLTDGAA